MKKSQRGKDKNAKRSRAKSLNLTALIANQLDEAKRGLRDTSIERDQRVHAARKAFKKARTLARLYRSVDEKAARSFGGEVTTIARDLAGARDADVRYATAQSLLQDCVSDEEKKALKKLNSIASAEANAAHENDVDIDILITRILTLKPPNRKQSTKKNAKSIGTGIGRIYQRGRSKWRSARRTADPDSLHEMRKDVKHRFHCAKLLPKLSPDDKETTKRLDILGEMLGWDHDLSVLADHAEAHEHAIGGMDGVAAIRRLIATRRMDLQRRIIRLGDPLFSRHAVKFESAAISNAQQVAGK